jgi:hypothetical protein
MQVAITVTVEADEVRDIIARYVVATVGVPPPKTRYRVQLQSWGDAEVTTEPNPLPPSEPVRCAAELPPPKPSDATYNLG